MLKQYVNTIEYGGEFNMSEPEEIVSEVLCDTKSIIYLLNSNIGYQKSLVNNKEELFEICLDTLVLLTVVQVLLRRISSANDITKRVWATLGWITMYLYDHEAFQNIDFLPIIDREKNKISVFMQKILEFAKAETDETVLIPDFSDEEKMKLLTSLLKTRNGTIIRV